MEPGGFDSDSEVIPVVRWSVARMLGALDQTRQAAEAIEPFPLSLIPLAGSPGAVRFSVAPWRPLFEVFDAIETSNQTGNLGALNLFRPHVGIAYSAAQQDPDPVRTGTRSAAHAESAINIPVAELLLVCMRRATGWYEWNEIARVRLGS